MERRSKAALTAALLSATFAERLTGSSPPWAFFNPALFALFLAMYGSGVNLSREFVVRRGKGPATLVALGLAYAVFEEALVLRTWFDPDSPNVRLVGDYGRFGATNVVWAVWVTPWLALLAIRIPCLATDLLFPDLRNEPYLSNRGVKAWGGAGAAVLAITLVLSNAYIPGPAEWGTAAALIVLLVLGAFRLGKDELRPAGRAPWSAAWPFAVIGALGAAVQFWSATGWRDMGAPAPVGAALIVAVWAGALIALRELIAAGSWRRDLAFLFAGVVVFFALRGLLLPGAPGMREVGAAALSGLLIVYRKLRPQQQRPAPAAP